METHDFNHRPRRSCLYTPGINGKAMEKGKSLPADIIMLDLEDAVAPDLKDEARNLVANIVSEKPYGKREVIIRMNELSSPWGKDDLEMINRNKPDGALVPKVQTAQDIFDIDAQLDDGIALWVMIEMPLAILNIQDIAAASQSTKLAGFIIGTNDLAKEFRATATPDRAAFQHALSVTLIAARAYDLIAIDGVYNNIQNASGLEDECRQGQIMGYDGKTLIHPNQIDITNRIFSPAIDDIEKAHAIVAAFELPENRNKGVIKVDGKMTELLHLVEAKRLIAMYDAINTSGDA